MKAFPRSNKYTLCLLGLVLAIELGWRFSLGDPCGAPPCNASSRAALATSSDRPWHRAVPGSLCAQSCRCVPQGTHMYSVLQKSPQETAGTMQMQQAQVSPSHDVRVDVLHAGSIFHLPAYMYVHVCMYMCVCSSCLLPWLDSRYWHCTESRCVWVGVTGGVGLEGTPLQC